MAQTRSLWAAKAELVAVDTVGSAGQATRCTSGRVHEGPRGAGNPEKKCDAQMVQDVEVGA